MASEMILADILNQEGTLFSAEWYYSTELRVVSPLVLYQIGLRLFDSWHWARTFAIAVMHLGVILSFLYMARAAGMKESAVYCAATLILPISQAYTFLFAYGGFYAAYFAMTCLVIGVVLRAHASRRKVLLGFFLVLTGVWSGMTGVRMLMILGVPLIFACAAALFGRVRSSASGKEVWGSAQFSMMCAASVHLAGMLVGYIINMHVLTQRYSFQSHNHVKLVSFGPERVLEQIRHWFGFFGYEPGCELLSLEGLASWTAVGIVCLAMVSVYILLKKGTQYGLTAFESMVPLFALCALAVGILTNGTTERGYNGYNEVYPIAYYISGVLMTIASAFMLMEKLPCRIWKGGIRTLLLLALSMAFFLEARSYTKNYYRASEANYEATAQWLSENGYTRGFATFWYGNLLTEASDGQLDMYVLWGWTSDELAQWLQKKSHFEQLPEGKVFVYEESGEALADPFAGADRARLVYEDVGGRVYECASAQEVMEIQKAYRARLLEEEAK